MNYPTSFEKFESIPDVLHERVQRSPDATAFVLMEADETAHEISNSQIWSESLRFAQTLKENHVGYGDLVHLVFNHSSDLIAAFIGSMLRGAVPSILPYLTSSAIGSASGERVKELIERTNVSATLTAQDSCESLRELLSECETKVFSAASTDVESASVDGWERPDYQGQDLAYIQFTSGTTGPPRGVMLSHRAVLNFIDACRGIFPFGAGDVSVGWLPLYHDMGLVGQVLWPLLLDASSVLIAPNRWIRRPVSLFKAVHRHRGTMTWMPNFAFTHCQRSIRDDDLQSLDLSSWKVIGNGSESVSSECMRAFADRFEANGLSRGALLSGYGLAENVLGVARTNPGDKPHVDRISLKALQEENLAVPVSDPEYETRDVVSSGFLIPGTEIKIVNDQGKSLDDRHVGTVLLRSRFLFSGYYNQPERTKQVMRDGWFDTGDLGYMTNQGLFICDRKKDLIIVRGINIYPDALEAVVHEEMGQNAGRVVAFGVGDNVQGTEAPVIVCEQRRPLGREDLSQLSLRIRQRLAEEINITLREILFVPRGWVHVTTSGKLARQVNREKYLKQLQDQETVHDEQLS
ncbi:MAG: hypothetical protein CMJ77_12870 [Planctomycetaceae bacterium]|nr:hypothetical protein [Planctomycetaceae bacterium]